MNSSTLRRLASDHSSLRRSPPPNYLFPSSQDGSLLPDDLTQLVILLTGAQGTPYAQGLWRLQLSMPDDYPKRPPKATFKTRIYHPNVEEATGAVCLDTLKRDWQSKLTLRDILITISCLLIHPNPDSALNSAAGSLLQEDYDAFAKQARLMTSIHAPIPQNLQDEVSEARRRGDSDGGPTQSDSAEQPATLRASAVTPSIVMKKMVSVSVQEKQQETGIEATDPAFGEDLTGTNNKQDDAKENDPTQSRSPVIQNPESTRRNVLGKRPLSELPVPVDTDGTESHTREDTCPATDSGMNVLAGQNSPAGANSVSELVRKSPRLDVSVRNTNAHGRIRQAGESSTSNNDVITFSPADGDDEKENDDARSPSTESSKTIHKTISAEPSREQVRPTLRKVSNVGSSRSKAQARTGIRRL